MSKAPKQAPVATHVEFAFDPAGRTVTCVFRDGLGGAEHGRAKFTATGLANLIRGLSAMSKVLK